jgi:hypothetical protein
MSFAGRTMSDDARDNYRWWATQVLVPFVGPIVVAVATAWARDYFGKRKEAKGEE